MSTPDAILLHACCGPCSITSVLRLVDMGFAPTLYFYNPNIHPLTEYLRRREGLLAVAQRLNVPVILPDQDELGLVPPGSPAPVPLGDAEGVLPAAADLLSDVSDDPAADLSAADPARWLLAVAGLGPDMNDMSRRCALCYDLRLARSARAARTLGFARFSSTLLYSRYQNHQAILESGQRHAGQGLDFVGEDFRPGWHEGIRLSKEWEIYRQPYCGCVLSEHDRYRKKIALKSEGAETGFAGS